MPYDITGMRVALQQRVSSGFPGEVTGESIAESFASMQTSDARLAERSASACLIPRNDGNGRAVVDCERATASSHAIQEKVLRRIATTSSGSAEVLDFMEIDTPGRIARECRGPSGELWHKKPWDIERLPPTLVRTRQASARHFACNSCDGATFLPIEQEAIAWPSWPTRVIVDDLKLGQNQFNFSEQLFLMAYRCLLQRVSQLRGLISADDYAYSDQGISDGYRIVLDERQRSHRQCLNALTNLKTKYDRRLTGIANLPMTHWVVPVEPAFPIASLSFAPVDDRHIATTVYPEPWERPGHTTEWRHWLVISAEAGHKWLLEPAVNAKAEAAQQTLRNAQNSIEWTINYIANEGKLSTYGKPESYDLFREQYPDATDRIEQRVTDDIVIMYYERCIGKALHIA